VLVGALSCRFVRSSSLVVGARRHAGVTPSCSVRIGPVPGVGLQLFNRVVSNIASGDGEDHARRHVAFWDRVGLDLTPPYDLAPQPRASSGATKNDP
jgi:hypothetical protein